MKITLELTSDEIEVAISNYIENVYNKKVINISFKTSGTPSNQIISAEVEITGNIR